MTHVTRVNPSLRQSSCGQSARCHISGDPEDSACGVASLKRVCHVVGTVYPTSKDLVVASTLTLDGVGHDVVDICTNRVAGVHPPVGDLRPLPSCACSGHLVGLRQVEEDI